MCIKGFEVSAFAFSLLPGIHERRTLVGNAALII